MTIEKKKVALLSNVTVDLIASKLRKKYDFYIPEGFDTWIQEVLRSSSGLYREKLDAIILLLDGTEARAWKSSQEGKERVDMWRQAISVLAQNITDFPIFVSTLDIRENRIKSLSEIGFGLSLEYEWYKTVSELVESKQNVFFLDIANLIRETGREHFYSNKMWYLSSMPYSRDGLNRIAAEIENVLSTVYNPRRKIIVVDLDNTLWGGVVGEDGVEGIVLSSHNEGQRYYDFQRQLLEMNRRGILLAISSKNNPEDVEAVFSSHSGMILEKDDFVLCKINWNDKAQSIKEIESELNITEGGFIFIDDNPIERETIKGECPEIIVPEFPQDSSELLEFSESIWKEYCRPLRVLREDSQKTRMYQDELKRVESRKNSLNLDEYIRKLEICVDIHKIRLEELERTAQLCNKTNQFNLTTKRYSQLEIEKMRHLPEYSIYTVHTADKYGDNGLIGVIILLENGKDVRIDTFLMSCRVMGRKLEELVIEKLAHKYSDKDRMIGEYIPTSKNGPVCDLYDHLGFRPISENNGHKVYELQIKEFRQGTTDLYKEVNFVE